MAKKLSAIRIIVKNNNKNPHKYFVITNYKVLMSLKLTLIVFRIYFYGL